MVRYVRNTYATKRRLNLLRSTLIAIFSTGSSDKLAIDSASAQKEEEDHDNDYTGGSETMNAVKLRVWKKTSGKPNSMQRVLDVSTAQRFLFLEQDN